MSDKEKKVISKGLVKSAFLNEDESWIDYFKTIFYAFLIAISFRTFVLQPFSIPSESMLKTLMVGDFLMVSKSTYGFSKHSLPWSLPLIPDRIFASDVERGDVVVFRHPRNPDTYYIKRIIGKPGDKIQIKSGALYLNDKKVPTKKLEDYVRTNEFGHEDVFESFEETMPNGKTYLTLNIGYRPRADDTDVYIVPGGHYFAIGDNRDNSLDSRWSLREDGVGYIPAENIIGKAKWITLSFDNKSSFLEVWKWFPAERRERFFSTIN